MTLTTLIQTIDDLDVGPDSGYSASFIHSFHQPGTTVTLVERAEGPEVTSVAPGMYRLSPIHIQIEDDDNADALQTALFRALDTTEAMKALVISDRDGSNRRYVMFATESLQQMPDSGGLGHIATLTVSRDIRWRADEDVTEELTWTASAQQKEIVVAGDLPVYPTYTITPRAGKTVAGWPYMMYAIIRWPNNADYRDIDHPINLVGAWNTAALVSSGQLSNKNNVAVLDENGHFVPFWYGAADGESTGWNNTSTKIWVNHRRLYTEPLELNEYVSDADLNPYLKIKEPYGGLPFTSGWLRFQNGEIISYNGRTTGQLNGVVRGVADTPLGNHNPGDLLERVSVYRIVWGPTSAIPEHLKDTAYLAAAARMPVINLTYSTNAVWRQEVFRRGYGRAAWWYVGNTDLAFTEPTDVSGIAGDFVTPWTAMGFRHDIRGLVYFGTTFVMPIKSVRIIGARHAWGYEIDYPGAPVLSVYGAVDNLINLWNAAESGSFDDFDVTLNTPTVADAANPALEMEDWRLFDSIRWAVPSTNHVQTDIQQVYVTFMDEFLPIVTTVSATNNYDMAMRLNNLTTAEGLFIDVQNVNIDASLIISTADSTVTYSADNSNRYTGVRQNTARPFFLKLQPGINTLTLIEDGLTDVDVEVRYTPRYYK